MYCERVAYTRLKMFWGALDFQYADESSYTGAQVKAGGTDANPPGIGVRRASLVFSRPTLSPPQDQMLCHFDFLNITGGDPDDTWVDADFASIEGYIDTMWTTLKTYAASHVVFDQIRWYRVGPGVPPPNPAVRITERNVAGTGGAGCPDQVAMSVTLRTVPRRQWGRTYLPCAKQGNLTTDGRWSSSAVDGVASAVNTMLQAASTADFRPVVMSTTRQKAYTVEMLQVDDLADVIRSRRFRPATYRKQYT